MRRTSVGKNTYARSASLEAAKRRAVALLAQEANRTIMKLAAVTLGDVSEELEAMLLEVARGFESDDASTRQKLFQEMGEAAQRSMVSAYGSLVTAREGPASATHYRAGQGRIAGGIVARTLNDPDFFTATSLGLEWGNKELLDSAAAQWHRLNFGAGGGGDEGEEFPVHFGGGEGTALSIDEEASKGFVMPKGIWLTNEGEHVGGGANPAGSDQFFPQSRPITDAKGNVRGGINIRPDAVAGRANAAKIEGKHFMDAGIRRIAEDLPQVMQQYADDRYKGLSRVRKRRKASAIVQFTSPASLLEIEIP